MKERPVLFSGPMVRALLAGTKTQTRRLITPQPEAAGCNGGGRALFSWANRSGLTYRDELWQFCPLGQPGDRLWVKESWRTTRSLDHCRPRQLVPGAPIEFSADEWMEGFGLLDSGRLRPSIFMCRWMSRLVLELTSVRVQRLHQISDDDCESEGIETSRGVGLIAGQRTFSIPGCSAYSRVGWHAYSRLWEDNYGRGSWAANPWVWVLYFRRVQP